MDTLKTIIVTGGAGYVGAVLVPQLLESGFRVKILDLYIYGDTLESVKNHPNLKEIKGDIRDVSLLEREISGTDIIIHLACISNDPSYELNPALGKSINYDAFIPLVEIAKKNKVHQFIYASSSSVYGLKDEDDVTEDLIIEPLTDYSKFKALCEEYLLSRSSDDFITTVIRPATICGYSPRLRLDLTVNILTNHAINKGEITIFGGEQKRPNIHIKDMVDLYLFLLMQPKEKIHKKIFNVGYQNYKIREIAEIVSKTLNRPVPFKIFPTNDNRSYHVSSHKIKKELGFEAKHTIEEAISDLKMAFESGKICDPLNDIRYYNVKMMQAINMK